MAERRHITGFSDLPAVSDELEAFGLDDDVAQRHRLLPHQLVTGQQGKQDNSRLPDHASRRPPAERRIAISINTPTAQSQLLLAVEATSRLALKPTSISAIAFT